jgi:hypothetical protein
MINRTLDAGMFCAKSGDGKSGTIFLMAHWCYEAVLKQQIKADPEFPEIEVKYFRRKFGQKT